jgi:hypothetical protein
MMASSAGLRKPENGTYSNQENPNKTNEGEGQQKSRRKAGKLPEKYDPMYPDMESVGREMANSESEDEEDLTAEYVKPDRVERRPGLTGGEKWAELPYVHVCPVEAVPKQNLKPLKKSEEGKGTPPLVDDSGKVYQLGLNSKFNRVVDKVTMEVFDTDITLKLRDLLAVSSPCGQNLECELGRQVGSRTGDAEVLPKKEVKFDPTLNIIPANLNGSKVKVFTLDGLGSIQTEKMVTDYGEVIRVVDPVVQFLQTHPDHEVKVIVGVPVRAIKSVLPIVNETRPVESLLDPGSSIVSMSSVVAEGLDLSWNPKWRIKMESANRTVNKTLGVAANVPFWFNHITIHLQVHILAEAAYEILLGRPFDCLTQSAVKNFASVISQNYYLITSMQ